jgi:ribonuclease R
MSAVITFGADGVEKGAWFGPTVIHSAERFTYESAQEVIDGAPHKYKDELMTAAHIARGLGKNRVASGALVLEQEEVKVLIDEQGRPTKVVKKIRTESHTLIEELMLLANRRIAEFLERGGKPKKPKGNIHELKNVDDGEHAVIYRIHDQPSEEKAEDLAFFMRSIGHPIPVRKDGSLDPKALVKVLDGLENGDLKQTVLTFVIRSMSKAIYTTKNIGHYGLQFDHYTHFTSPIRRYPDVLTHRLLMRVLGGDYPPESERGLYEKLCMQASRREKEASDAERGSIKYKQVEYMSYRVGQEFDGMVSGVSEWGIFVEEKKSKCEGMIRLRDLGGDDFYNFDQKGGRVFGERTGIEWKIGTPVKIKVKNANLDLRVIDYTLAG